MRQLLFLIFLFCQLLLHSQEVIYARDVMIPITQLDSNILWAKTVVREIDLNDSQYSITLKGQKEELVESLVNSVKEGRDTAYYCRKQLAPEMMDSLRVRVGKYGDLKATFRKFEYSDVGSILIVENWYYLKRQQVIRKQIVALYLKLNHGVLSPADPKNDHNPLDFWERGVFWIY